MTDKTSILIQDRQARLRMARLEEKMNTIANELQTLASSLQTMSTTLMSIHIQEPTGGSCPKCSRWIDFTNPDFNAACFENDCPCGLTEITHEINS